MDVRRTHDLTLEGWLANVLSIPSTSKQFIGVPVTGGYTNSTPVDIAVVAAAVDEPASGDWKTAVWDSGQAKILIGPGTSLPLADGIYRVWVRITSTAETPVIPSGLIRIT